MALDSEGIKGTWAKNGEAPLGAVVVGKNDLLQ
jgi:hypothetical protein